MDLLKIKPLVTKLKIPNLFARSQASQKGFEKAQPRIWLPKAKDAEEKNSSLPAFVHNPNASQALIHRSEKSLIASRVENLVAAFTRFK